MTDPQPQTPPPVEFVRDEDFESLYANSVISEISVWDLKLVFGILDQSKIPHRVVQHTSINIPWVQAKLWAYWTHTLLAVHEHQNGKVTIPASILPPDPATVPTEGLDVPPELREKLSQIYKTFIASL